MAGSTTSRLPRATAAAERVFTPEELAAALERAKASGKSYVIDAICVNEQLCDMGAALRPSIVCAGSVTSLYVFRFPQLSADVPNRMEGISAKPSRRLPP